MTDHTGTHITGSSAAECVSRYFRTPEAMLPLLCTKSNGRKPGFFRVGSDAIAYGQCATISLSDSPTRHLADAWERVSTADGIGVLPFDLNEVVRNLHLETYSVAVSGWRKYVRNAYYSVRPKLTVGTRKYLQRMYLSGWKKVSFPHWPVDRSADRLLEQALALGLKASGAATIPFIWFWPGAHSSCAIVTHDVEATMGRDFTGKLIELDASFGMKASYQVVPEERYDVPMAYLDLIRDHGCEVNVHDLNHDGMLFSDRNTFLERAKAINRYGRTFRARGFRSGAMYRNQEWFQALEFEYDMSVPNVAHLEPQGGGCCSIMPYFIGNLLELPLTTIQDYAVFHIFGERNIDIWKEQISEIQRNHGLITILSHPDYIIESWAQDIYAELLGYLAGEVSAKNIWLTTPGQVNDWWRLRSKLSLQPEGAGWQIVGEGSDRARIAYASLVDGVLQYSFDPMSPGTISKTANPASGKTL